MKKEKERESLSAKHFLFFSSACTHYKLVSECLELLPPPVLSESCLREGRFDAGLEAEVVRVILVLELLAALRKERQRWFEILPRSQPCVELLTCAQFVGGDIAQDHLVTNASALDAVEVRARPGTPSNPAVLVGVPGPPHEKFLELFLKFLDAPFSNELCFRNRHGSGRHQLRARARASRKVSRRTTTSRTMARGCRAFPGLLQEISRIVAKILKLVPGYHL